MKQKGFTLIELMITVAIVALLASIAIPSYTQYVQKSRRSEAFNALNATINAMEKYRLSENTYPTDINTLNGVIQSHGLTLNGSNWESENGDYQLSIGTSGGVAVSVMAQATNTGNQFDDTDCRFFIMTLDGDQLARRSDMTVNTDQCWPD